MASSTSFLDAIAGRRSVYAISKESPIPNDRIQEIVNQALKHAPSPFNVRSARAIVLFGEEHVKLWDVGYKNTIEQTPQAEAILGPKIKAFQAGYGTVLFFDDSKAFDLLTPRFAGLAKTYPEWEEHSSGMHQYIVWTALAAEGLGVSCQHYQASAGSYVEETYDVPESWKLKCQLVFGKPVGPPPAPATKTHLEVALRTYG